MEYLLSFAQEREDIILYHLLKNVNGPIRYVDVGANDPVSHSVTKLFYDRGASGINIEPQHKHIDQLNQDRPRDINLEVGISNKAGELTLYGKDKIASFDHTINDQEIVHTVPVITLSDVFNKYVSKGDDIHFLKIDVEGWERQCLEGMDFLQFRPWILCIESRVPNTAMPCHENWEELILGQNYVFLGDTYLNRYYVAAERLHEIQEFRQPEELDAIYKIISFLDTDMLDESIISLLRKQKVVLFGAGLLGRWYWRQIQDLGLPLTAWIASWPQEGFPVDTLEKLYELEYDVILVVVMRKSTAEEVREILINREVPSEKILWCPPVIERSLRNICFNFEGKNYYAYH